MIAILEKTEHNIDFHLIVDFIEASYIRVYNFSKMTFDGMVRNVNSKGSNFLMYLRDDSQGEAFPTVSSLDARQDRENIIKTFALPHESSPRVTSLNGDEGSMQQQLQELMDLCTSLQRQQTQMAAKIKDQDLEISCLKARVKILEDKDRGREEPQEDAPIKGGSIEIGEEVGLERSTELGSNDKEEMVNVLSDMDAANILTSGVATVSVSPVAAATTVGVPTISRLVPTRLSEQLVRDYEIARLHAEEELKMMIEGLDRSNKMIAKHYTILRSHAGWKTRHFRGMTLEEIKQKFIPIWKQIEEFLPMSSREEDERMKMKGLKLDQGSFKRMKTSKDVSEEDLKGMMQLVPVEEEYVKDLQVKHPIIDWEIHSEGKKDYWNITRLGGYTADICTAGSESRPPMLNKENYVPWSSRLLRYAKSRPNGKLIHNSILNGPYVRRMIPEPGDANRDVNVNKTFHEQINDELSEKEVKQIEADDQAIQTILLGLPEYIYAVVDSCETAQEIWLRVHQMMKGSDIGI
uniref:Uncharacterized protein n=1 Tax=Tanacetum cinerariifolium TaxID=118510 RepID=A0A699I9R8_TANCI|nr:hypothetical protein [Tanacetum cinerariifolium]